MNRFDIKRLGQIFAIQAEIEGMKAANARRAAIGGEPVYDEYYFDKRAEEIREIVNKKDEEL